MGFLSLHVVKYLFILTICHFILIWDILFVFKDKYKQEKVVYRGKFWYYFIFENHSSKPITASSRTINHGHQIICRWWSTKEFYNKAPEKRLTNIGNDWMHKEKDIMRGPSQLKCYLLQMLSVFMEIHKYANQ